MKETTIDDCRIIDFPKIVMPEGSLTAVHGGGEVPFDIARVFYLYDVPGGESRGGHAHRELQQLIVSVMGAFNVTVDDGRSRRTFTLNRAFNGLYVPPYIWAEVVEFSSGGVCLVLASMPYQESDYFRDYDQFVEQKHDRTIS